MKYRGLLKKRLFPVEIAGEAPSPGTPVLTEGGTEVGEMRSSSDGLGLALLRLDSIGKGLSAGNAQLSVRPPAWLVAS